MLDQKKKKWLRLILSIYIDFFPLFVSLSSLIPGFSEKDERPLKILFIVFISLFGHV